MDKWAIQPNIFSWLPHLSVLLSIYIRLYLRNNEFCVCMGWAVRVAVTPSMSFRFPVWFPQDSLQVSLTERYALDGGWVLGTLHYGYRHRLVVDTGGCLSNWLWYNLLMPGLYDSFGLYRMLRSLMLWGPRMVVAAVLGAVTTSGLKPEVERHSSVE